MARSGNRRTPPPATADPGQVGKRPSPVWLLFLISAMWIIAGIFALVSLHASWKLVAGIVFIGIGILYLRAAALSVVRRSR